MSERRQISISALQRYWQCPVNWRKRYIDKPDGYNTITTAMLRGTAAHAAIEAALRRKMESSGLNNGEEYVAVIPTAVDKEWRKVVFTDDEMMVARSDVRDGVIAEAERIASFYIESEVPSIKPIGVESAFCLHLPGCERWEVIGRIDIVEDGRIRDVKTSRRCPDEDVAEHSDQLSLYALAYYAETGKLCEKLQLDYVIPSKRIHTVARETTRTKEQLGQLCWRIATTLQAIEAEVYHPALRGKYGQCKKSACSFYSGCVYGGSTHQHFNIDAVKSVPTQEELDVSDDDQTE